jgi:hypothetical protein
MHGMPRRFSPVSIAFGSTVSVGDDRPSMRSSSSRSSRVVGWAVATAVNDNDALGALARPIPDLRRPRLEAIAPEITQKTLDDAALVSPNPPVRRDGCAVKNLPEGSHS